MSESVGGILEVKSMGQKILEGFLFGFGAAFGWALGNGLITIIAGALMRGHGG